MPDSKFEEVERSWDSILERLVDLQEQIDFDDAENIASVISGMEFQIRKASDLTITDPSHLEQWNSFIRNLKMRLATMEI